MYIKNTLFVGKVLLEFEALASTNGYAAELLAKSRPIDGTVISTFRQTAGRGQIGSHWESEPDKNIALSIILYPTFLPPRHQFYLNMAIAIAVRDVIAKYTEKKVTIKWPNDIYVETRKIVGILIQNTLAAHTLQTSIIGIGINVNQIIFSENAPNATSLALETGHTFSLHDLIEDLCQQVEQRYLSLKNSNHNDKLYELYLSYLYQFGVAASYQKVDRTLFTGTITGISESGKLIVENSGVSEAFDIKAIRFLNQ